MKKFVFVVLSGVLSSVSVYAAQTVPVSKEAQVSLIKESKKNILEIADGKDEYLNNISTVITQQSLEQGVYIRPLGNTVYIMPPYCITKDELDKVYYVLMDLMEKLKNVLEKR